MMQEPKTQDHWVTITPEELHLIAKAIPKKHWDGGLSYDDQKDEKVVTKCYHAVVSEVNVRVPTDQLRWIIRFLLSGREA